MENPTLNSVLLIHSFISPDVVEFEDQDGDSSSDLDEYDSEDDIDDFFSSSSSNKKPPPVSAASKHKPAVAAATKPAVSNAKKVSSNSSSSKAKTKVNAVPAKTEVTKACESGAERNVTKKIDKEPAKKEAGLKTNSSDVKDDGAAKKSTGDGGSLPEVGISGAGAVGSFLGMREYMEAMDRELSRTSVGQSFVRKSDNVSLACF